MNTYQSKYYKYKSKYLELKQKKKFFTCINWQKSYLKNVCIITSNGCLNLCSDKNFLKQLFNPKSFYNLYDTQNVIANLEIIQKDDVVNFEDNFLKKKWKYCDHKCFKELSELIQNELNSTAYMLRLLANSLITIEDGKIEFEYNNEELTGFWKDDQDKFVIKTLGNNKNNRLIFGFGPSASGKTYWAENIIKLFSSKIDNFPKTFISIDGGLYRELSTVYQYIISNLNKNDIGGFINLVTAGLATSKSLFISNQIKKNMIKYLTQQNNISLYVPLTLGGCIKKWCNSSYQKYINIANDPNWIGLLIYQHKTGLECPYREKYRCIGCTESGKEREIKEGKKYSASAYNNSMTNGKYAISRAPGGQFEIHNTGGFKYKETNGQEVYSKSIFKEHSINSKYIFEDIPDEFNSVYIRSK